MRGRRRGSRETFVARICDLTGKRASHGNTRSHAMNHTRRRWQPNLHDRNIFVPELGRTIKLRVSTAALRTLDKKGLAAMLRDQGISVQDLA